MRKLVSVGAVVLAASCVSCTFDRSGVAPASSAGDASRDAGVDDGGQGRDLVGEGSADDLPVDLPGGCPSSCLLGCQDDSGACRHLTPSNTQGVGIPSCGPVQAPAGTSTISTATCQLPGGCAGQVQSTTQVCVVRVDTLQIPAGTTIRVEGPNGLIILSDGEVDIGGTLDASGSGTQPGPGGGSGGVPPGAIQGAPGECPPALPGCNGQGGFCSGCTADDCGGGGGGFGTGGGDGGYDGTATTCVTPSKGGGTYGDATLVPLVGGSGGASGNNLTATDPAPAAGGGGGGAIQISAQGVLRVDGLINVGGGGGVRGDGVSGGCGNGGGGGGSGGAVLLEAPRIEGSGWIAANGGGGGGGAAPQGMAQPGQDGQGSSTPAQGGAPYGSAGAGGAGSTGDSQPAAPGLGGLEAGGGGGGGAGRIRLNWDQSRYPAPTVQVSGVSSVGQISLP